MTGDELRSMRERLGMGRVGFGRLLGYSGNTRNVRLQVRRLENGSADIMFEVTEDELRARHEAWMRDRAEERAENGGFVVTPLRGGKD